MNRDRAAVEWKQFSGSMREQWGRLTHDPQREFACRRDEFTSRIQERYGISRQKADRLAESFMSRDRKWWDLLNRQGPNYPEAGPPPNSISLGH